mmetsp:Transcript_25350/g.38747  ORF Transcript_25350/g.38747 Transcript_25350/m.38747 type:complete len:118 (+) Transcript_25350:761-1114(+)
MIVGVSKMDDKVTTARMKVSVELYKKPVVGATYIHAYNTPGRYSLSYLIPMRIAKHTLWRNPSSQPKLTRLAVAAARTYAMQMAEMRVKMNDLVEMSTMKPEKPTAIIAAPKAVDSI